MKVAMPIWQGRISPVMDSATRLLIVEYDCDRETNRTEESIAGRNMLHVAHHLAELGIDTLICGAISHPLLSLFAAQRISVVPWLTGPTEEILAAFRANRLENRRFLMPGCRARFRGCPRGRGRGAQRGQQQKQRP